MNSIVSRIGLMVVALAAANLSQAEGRPAGPRASPAAYAASGVFFLNGGIGRDEAQQIEAQSTNYNLRLVFSEGRKSDFAADVHLKICDATGRVVLTLSDAGPLTDVQLPPGRYQVDARFGHMQRHNTVDLKDGQPMNLYLHFPHDGGSS